jgi:hypothetical protein
VSSEISSETTLAEMGAIVCEALKKRGIDAFLSGGAVVSIYTNNKYESFDLDFVSIADRKKIRAAMIELGFKPDPSRHFVHPKSKYFVEFPGAAVKIGDQPITEFSELRLPQGVLKLLTPTDSVKDRLAAYYHWNDRQGLNQAVWIAQARPVKLEEIKSWSLSEGMETKFKEFLVEVKQLKK